jgi:hypothetical protein
MKIVIPFFLSLSAAAGGEAILASSVNPTPDRLADLYVCRNGEQMLMPAK